MENLVVEKVAQAIEILKFQHVDLWLTFVRETPAKGDPAMPLIFGEGDLTWQSALILTASGERIAVVGRYEAEAVRLTGAYPTIVSYDTTIRPILIDIFDRLNPQQIAVNYSPSDELADGLSHGMYQVLESYLEGTRFASRLVSAESVIGSLRGCKTSGELQRIQDAIQDAERLFIATFQFTHPGMSERQISQFMHAETARLRLVEGWNYEDCPIVNAGADSPVGHIGPSENVLQPGQILHIDFGVRKKSYCSDLQRVAYVLRPGEKSAPAPVKAGFDTVVRAIQAAMSSIKPGVIGFEVDQIARSVIKAAGYPEYQHALGHQVGRLAHDGGTLLGPEWEKYGNLPRQRLVENEVYTIEPGVMVPDYGYIGIEEDIVVTSSGARFLSTPQTEIVYLK